MKSLGDKIRDSIIEKYSTGKGKKVEAMERAAAMMKISRSQLYNILNAVEIPVETLEEIKKILGIDVNALRNELLSNEETPEGRMKVYTFPIKNKREAKLMLPTDADKEDVKTVIKHLNLFETNLS